MRIILRAEAISKNLKYYYTGKPCKHGHFAYRFTSDGKCKDCSLIRNRASYKRNRVKRLETIRRYHSEHSDEIKAYMSNYVSNQYANDATEWRRKRALAQRTYLKNNPQYREHINEHVKNRYASDVNFRLSCIMRQHLHRVKRISGKTKSGRTFDCLGYSPNDLRCHLESLFEDGMSWDNYGEWHIDHIVPLTVMIEYGVIESHLVNALDNLQPMWAFDNISKGNRFTG